MKDESIEIYVGWALDPPDQLPNQVRNIAVQMYMNGDLLRQSFFPEVWNSVNEDATASDLWHYDAGSNRIFMLISAKHPLINHSNLFWNVFLHPHV